MEFNSGFKGLNAELNPICRLLALLRAHHILHVSRIRVNNKHLFDKNNEINNYKTRNNNNLHLPIANLSKFNKGASISVIKVFNNLPQYINPLNANLNPICHLLALLGAYHIFHISRIRVKA